jgi:putative transcriptional regulator
MTSRRKKSDERPVTMTSEEVKSIRSQLGISQEQFARDLGIATASVYRWEAGKSQPSPLHAKLIRQFAEGRGIAIA